jgi:glycosyltransferase involved in cell wall biosynthesis
MLPLNVSDYRMERIQDMPAVSIIIPTYNRAEYLEEAIRSVLTQTFRDFEIIVVDDGSTDNTPDVIKKFSSREIKYIFQENRGAGAARNAGVLGSSGRLVAFLDADDIWLPFKLETQIQALTDHPQARVVYCDMFFFGAVNGNYPETYFRSLKWPPPEGRVMEKMAAKSFGIPSTLLVYREVFEQTGLFDETLPHCDDYDMLLRLADCFEFAVVPVPLVKYRLHPEQISKNEEAVLIEHIAVFHKALKLPEVQGQISQTIQRRLADTHFQYAVLLVRHGRRREGLKQVMLSARTDPPQLFPSAVSLLQRTLKYIVPRRRH